MMKHWLAGAAAFAMMTGVAFAEDASTTTRSMTTSTAPAVGGYKSSEIHRDIDRDGSATRTKKTYHSNANGSTVTRTRTVMPDGSRTMSREKETAPYSGSSIEKTTTTTIDR
jgi:hypothetical protein